MIHIWQAVTGTPYPTTTWKWMDPGVMAALGAAGLLSGVNRLAVASTVIVVRINILKRLSHNAIQLTLNRLRSYVELELLLVPFESKLLS